MVENSYKSIEWYETRLKEYQMLQALVHTFHKKFEDDLSKNTIDKYIKHFGLTTIREGKIDNNERNKI